MKALKVLPLALAAAASLTLVSVPAQARTAAEETRCRAVGEAFTILGMAATDLAKEERAKLTASSTEEEKATVDSYADVGEQSTSIGAALKERYASATAPTDDEIAAAGALSIEELLAEGNKCV